MSDRIVEGFIRPQLFDEGGELNAQRFNLEMARLQAQLNHLLERLGGSDLLGPAQDVRIEQGPVDTPAEQILQGEYIATTTDSSGWIVNHNLGRVPDYCIIARAYQRVDAIWDNGPWTDTFINLDASHNNRSVVLYVW